MRIIRYRDACRPLSLLLFTVFANLLLAGTAHAGTLIGSIGTADTQVTPNTFGEYRTAAEDMRVKVLGGYIRITRDWVDGAWSLNKRWSPINTSADAQYKDEPYQHCWSSYTDNDGVYHAGGCEMLTQKVFVGITRNGVPYNTTLRTEETKDGTLLTTYQQDNDKRNVLEVETKSVEGSDTPEVIGLKWRNTDGDWIRYDPSNGGRVSAYGDRNNVQVSLQYDSTGRLNGLLDHNGKQVVWYDYDAEGRVGAVRDYSGRKVEYHYTSGKLTGVVDVRGNTWVYGYNGKGLLSKKVDPNGHATTLEYATNGALTVFRDPSGAEKHYKYEFDKTKREFYKQEKSAAGVVTETWYDKDGAFLRKAIAGTVVKRIERDGNTETEYNEAGNATVKQYDSWHRLIKQTHPDGTSTSATYYADTAWPTKHSDENGVVTKYEYDAHGNLTKLTEAVGKPEQRVTDYTYDGYGNRLTKTVEADSVSEAVTEKYTYDAYGNQASYTDGEGYTTSYTYDVLGNTNTVTDPLKHTWKYSNDAGGNRISMIDPLGRTTTWEYDKAALLIKKINFGNRVEQFVYDVNGRLITSIDALNGEIRMRYDSDGNTTSITDEVGHTIQKRSYDSAGRLIKVVDAGGNEIVRNYYSGGVTGAGYINSINYPNYTLKYNYDSRGRYSSQSYVGDGQDLTVRYFYDNVGNKNMVTDAKGRTTKLSYDGLGRIVETIDPMGAVTTFGYDNRDNLIKITDANGGVTHYDYFKTDLIRSEVRPMGGVITYDYDEMGNLIHQIDAEGRKVTYLYDEVGRRKAERFFANVNDDVPEQLVNFSYDEADNLAGYDNGATSANYSYDALDRLTGTTVHFGSFSKTFRYGYWPNGEKKIFVDPEGNEINYSYDTANNLNSITIPDVGTYIINKYQWGAPTQLTLPGGSSQTISYDPFMQVTSINDKDPAGAPLVTEVYEYDEVGNVAKKQSDDGEYIYKYDNLDRLTQANSESYGNSTYSYDALGNRLTDSNQNGAWSYNFDNQFTKIGDNDSYQYDASGSLASRSKAGTTRTYHYNASNRLIKVEDNGDVLGQYSYDPFGRCLSKTLNGRTIWFLYSEEGLIGEYDENGSVIRQYGWWPDGSWGTEPVYLQSKGKTYFYHNDHIGTPLKLTSSNGTVVWSAKYESFGYSHIKVNSIENPLRLAGQYFDAEAGTNYNYFRDYDPIIGRYIESDPIGLRGGLNTYAYVNGNPINYTDEYGLICGTGACVAIVVTVGRIAVVGWRWYKTYKKAKKARIKVCKKIYKAYKAACGVPCMGTTCKTLTYQANAARMCFEGRRTYVQIDCDAVIPTRVNHPEAAKQAKNKWDNCVKKRNTACASCSQK